MTQTHWDEVYLTKGDEALSWYEDAPTQSLAMIARAGGSGSVVDVGAGRSTLVDALSLDGRDVTVLDISDEPFRSVRGRLAAAGLKQPDYVVTDVIGWRPTQPFGLWHDRAVFHFLTDPADQHAYADTAARVVAPGGAVVLGTFAPDGPESCSGLPTARHDDASIAAIFGPNFDLEHSEQHVHRTPWSADQAFAWVILRRKES